MVPEAQHAGLMLMSDQYVLAYPFPTFAVCR